jgi:uncharacterized RDD family membrane protein YckC
MEGLKTSEPMIASGLERLLARLIDFGMICAFAVSIGVVAGLVTLVLFPQDEESVNATEIDPSNPVAIGLSIGAALAILAVEVVMVGRRGQSPGKRLMGLVVVNVVSKKPPGIAKALIRTCLWGVPAGLGVAFWWTTSIAWIFPLVTVASWAWLFRNRDRRAAHDLAAGTRVLRPR